MRCPTGEARITPAFGALQTTFVIHTVGPIYESPAASEPLLTAAYENSLKLAGQRDLRSVAFPAISCGVYGYPLDEAASVALRVVGASSAHLQQVAFVLFDDRAYDAWVAASAQIV